MNAEQFGEYIYGFSLLPGLGFYNQAIVRSRQEGGVVTLQVPDEFIFTDDMPLTWSLRNGEGWEELGQLVSVLGKVDGSSFAPANLLDGTFIGNMDSALSVVARRVDVANGSFIGFLDTSSKQYFITQGSSMNLALFNHSGGYLFNISLQAYSFSSPLTLGLGYGFDFSNNVYNILTFENMYK